MISFIFFVQEHLPSNELNLNSHIYLAIIQIQNRLELPTLPLQGISSYYHRGLLVTLSSFRRELNMETQDVW